MSKSKAIISVIIASVLVGLFPSSEKLILANGTPPLVLVVCCNGVACLVGLAASIFRHRSLKLTRRQVPAIILVGFCGLFLTDYLLDIAYTLIPVGYVTMLHFMYPSLVCLFMALLFHERITKWKTLAIISSVIGLALLAGGGFSGSMAGIGIAVITSFTYVFYMIASDKTAARQIPVEVRLFYSNLVVTIAAGIFVIVSSGKTPLVFPKGTDIVLTLIVGCMLGTAILLLNAGLVTLGAATTSFINMIEPVASLVISSAVYRYSITAAALTGCACILCSLVFTTISGDHAS